MKSAIIQFPGSNCDQDCAAAAELVWGVPGVMVWHQESVLPAVDVVIVPGGFSYGDYLRSGALAAKSPVMQAVQAFAQDGGLVLGICNGFQILTEAGLLPGALLRNRTLQFACRPVWLRVEQTETPFTRAYHGAVSPVVQMPIAHMDGGYYADESTLAGLERNGQILFRYCDATGAVTPAANPNGSCHHIAGVCNSGRNVLGLMPHPERVVDPLLGMTDGRGVFTSIMQGMA